MIKRLLCWLAQKRLRRLLKRKAEIIALMEAMKPAISYNYYFDQNLYLIKELAAIQFEIEEMKK